VCDAFIKVVLWCGSFATLWDGDGGLQFSINKIMLSQWCYGSPMLELVIEKKKVVADVGIDEIIELCLLIIFCHGWSL